MQRVVGTIRETLMSNINTDACQASDMIVSKYS